MADIKSAREIAMEKVEKLGSITDEERLKWKFVPEGEKLAAKYFKENCNLLVELNKYEQNTRNHVVDGAKDILIRNIDLPKDEASRKNTKKAMDGLRVLIQDKVGAENVFSKMRRVFEHYQSQGSQQKQQTYEKLKAEFTAKVQQAIQQQYGTAAGFKVDVERQPQFQEEWLKLQAQLDSQYLKLLDEYKQEIKNLS